MAPSVTVSSAQELSAQRIDQVRDHLEEVMASRAFAGSKRAGDFLRLIVGHALAGEVDCLRERMIGAEMFGRRVGYDTGSDSVVRVKATEVRKKLAQYYLEAEGKPVVRIELPSGSYVPRFHFEPAPRLSSEPDFLPSLSPAPLRAPLGEPSGAPKQSDRTFRLLGFFPRWWPLLAGGVAIAIGLIAIAGYLAFKRWGSNASMRSEPLSVAILPLENLSGDPGQDYFADGMTDELIAELGQVSALRVISRTSAMSYKGTKKRLPEIARDLGVQEIVEGSVLREGNEVRITAELIDAGSDRHIWSRTYVRDLTSVLALQGEVAQAIANEVRTTVTPPEQARLGRVRPVDTKAQDLYLRGMLWLNTGDFQQAAQYFKQAIVADHNFAQAHAALADSYGWMGESGMVAYTEAFSEQKAEAFRVVALDPSLPEGHVELANAAMNLDWDWSTAAKELHRAQELNPNSSYIHERYAVYLERTGKLHEAVAEAMEGVKVDPVSFRAYRNAGFTFYFSRQYDQALALIKRVHDLNLNVSPLGFLLGDIDAEKGLYGESVNEFLKMGDEPHGLGHLGNVYARAGQTAAARKTILQLEAHVRQDGVGRYEIALVYAGLGEKDEAFRWLEEAYKAHDEGLTNLKIDPCLDPLRSDPRLSELEWRVGLDGQT